MILAVDAGNTRVKVFLAGPGRVVALFAIETARLVEDPGIFLRRLETRRRRVETMDAVAICSVVPALDRRLPAALRDATGRPVLVVGHTCRLPFRLRVVDPAKVGPDRLSAAAGALGLRRSSAVIVDVGSAVTVDLVVGGEFRGGLIMPGPGLGLWALGRYARRLPRIDSRVLWDPSWTTRFDDTEPSMMLGVRTAVLGGVLEAVRLLRHSSGVSPQVFVTGGGLRSLGSRLPRAWRRDEYLVAKGLFRLWTLNCGSHPRRRG